MAEFAEVVRNRRMTRAFEPDPVEPALLDELVDLAARAPSAGKSQGWHLVVLEGTETKRYWDIALPAERREGFRWKYLLDAPVLALALADPDAYVQRYAEPDKARSGLGTGTDAWPAPYWTIDASMAVMTMLLAAENVGLGALFFGVFRRQEEIRAALDIPDRLELVGAIALGHPKRVPDSDAGATDADVRATGPGLSADRRRRPPSDIIHRRRW